MEEPKYTKWDEYLIHQTADTLDLMAGSEKEWFDWFVMDFVPPAGHEGPTVVTGMACYPNTKTMQGYVQTRIGNVQYNFRASREIHHDRADTVIGPLSFTVTEPIWRWRVKLDENPIVPVVFDVELQGTVEPYLCKTVEAAPESGLERAQRWAHMIQPLRWNGSITVDGTMYHVKDWGGIRDRSWGIRTMRMGIALWTWFNVSFKDGVLWIFMEEDRAGKMTHVDGVILPESGARVRIVDIKHNLTFDMEKDVRTLTRGEWDLLDDTGRWHKLTAVRTGEGNIYGGSWSGEGWWEYKGYFHMEGEKWDLTDPELRRAQASAVKQEPFEFELDGEKGEGKIEYGVSRKHPRYGASL